MLKYHTAVATISLFLAAGGGYYIAYKKFTDLSHTSSINKPCNFRSTMRKLWAEHVFWLRNYMIAALSESSDLTAAADRLKKNLRDIADAMIPYYGKEAGKKLALLLKEHRQIAMEVIAAAHAGNHDKLAEADRRWRENAESIARFFSNANTNWPYEVIKRMLYSHLTLTMEELIARLQKAWKDDIATFDKSFEQALDMADHLTQGILTQFPHKF